MDDMGGDFRKFRDWNHCMAPLEQINRSQVNLFRAVLNDLRTVDGHSVPILFVALVFYVFEVQLLMQIIIN